MLLTADAAANYYNGNVSVAWTIDNGNSADSWCRSYRMYYIGNVSVAWTTDDWQCCWQLMPQLSTTTGMSLLPEPLTIGNAADSWCRSQVLQRQRLCCLNHRQWQFCWKLMPQLQYVLHWKRLCCLNHRRLPIDAADSWCRYHKLYKATSLLPESSTVIIIAFASDNWCFYM